MKNLKELLFFFAALFFLASCSSNYSAMQKRYNNRSYVKANEIEAPKESYKREKQVIIASQKGDTEYKIDDLSVERMFDQSTLSVVNESEVSALTNANKKEENTVSLKRFLHQKTDKVEVNSTEQTIASLSGIPLKSKTLKKYLKAEDVWESQDAEGSNTTLALIGMISSILGCVAYCGGPVFGLAGAIMSLIALGKIKKNPGEYGGKTMATIGLILGIASVVFWTCYFLFILAIISSTGGQ